MPNDVGNIRYTVREPFERAFEFVCDCLNNHGLQITGCVDIAERLQRKLGIDLAPCRVIFVLPKSALLSRGAVHPWAATFLPLHVVVSGNDVESEIQVQNRIRPGEGAASALLRPVIETQAKLTEAMGTIAMRPSLV